MQKDAYGYFDNERREYVITEPLTPRPWVNYLSNGRMGAFISQGAGGLAWYNQPVSQRISRYDFLGLPEDRPGFYVYIRESDGAYWNPSYQPCQTEVEKWECRHGMGYTRFHAERNKLSSDLTFFVPRNDDVVVWELALFNGRESAEDVFVTNYIEFSLFEYWKEILGWVVLRNQVQFFYDQKIGAIKYRYFVYEAEHTNPVFLSGSGTPSGYDCDRTSFIGRGRDTSNPAVVEKGRLTGSSLPAGGGLGIGALGYNIRLQPGQTTRVAWTLGTAETWEKADELAGKFKDLAVVDKEFAALKEYWEKTLSVFQAILPDKEMECIVNSWNPYGTFTTFFRDRDISPDLTGLNAGLRFRDAMQNCMSLCILKPEPAAERIELIMRHHFKDGRALDAFRPGAKNPPPVEQPRCDNNVWPPITIYLYLAETGNFSFLDKRLPYLNGGDATIYEILMNGLRQITRDAGVNGLPLLKGRDWDDHLAVFESEGAESVMTAQNWCYAGRLMQEICRTYGRPEDAEWIERQIAEYTNALNKAAWDGEWYRQVIFNDGRVPLGSKKRRENKIYINTQAWAVISGTAPEERAALCLNKMRQHLNTPGGIKFLIPPYTGIPEPEDPLVSNGPGLGENGGIFIQANCWAIMAEAMLGRGERAYEYYRQVLPPVVSRTFGPDVYRNEPYMFSSNITTEPHPRKGMANLSWLTGTTNWMYIAATQHILGILPTLTGLKIRPALPAEWEGFTAVRRFRGATYRIKVVNEKKGSAPKITVDGKVTSGNILPLAPPGNTVHVSVVL